MTNRPSGSGPPLMPGVYVILALAFCNLPGGGA